MNGRELYQYIQSELEIFFDEKERIGISKSLLADLAKVPPPWTSEMKIPAETKNLMDAAIRRIIAGEPTQYVCGIAPFRYYLFHVTDQVLIPRPETEELVSLVLEMNDLLPSGKGLDIGTGTGAIAISLSLESDRMMDALDISEPALLIAQKNVEKYLAKVKLFQSDIFQNPIFGPYSFIVSNPPYICRSEKIELSPSVFLFEPEIALFVPDESPLLFYREIIGLAAKSLLPKGGLFFECHYQYAEQVRELMEACDFSKVQIRRDLSGKQRMVFGFKPDSLISL